MNLREQCKDLFRVDYNNVIKVVDIVVVENPMKSRPYWSLGRVMEVTSGGDNLVRSAKIKKPDWKMQEHSIKQLYPLELSITHSPQLVIPFDENSVSDVLASSRSKTSTHKKILIPMNLLFCFCKNSFFFFPLLVIRCYHSELEWTWE